MRKCLGLVLCLMLLGAVPASAAEYPVKPITCIVPFAPGGAADISVRMMVDKIQNILGQPVVVVNKGGGSGVPGLMSALRATPDGYTVVGGPSGSPFVAAYFLDAEPFDLKKIDFVAAYMLQERILLAGTDKPYKTWEEFAAYVKAHPGEVSMGSGASQEALEVVRSAALRDGLRLKYVMYKSGGEASADLMGGHIDVCELGVGTPGYQAARKGLLNILVNLGSNKVPFFEQLPSLKDKGYAYDATLQYGFLMPDGTPEAIRVKWEAAVRQALEDPDLKQRMLAAGFRPQFTDGAAYRAASEKKVSDVQSMLEYNKKHDKK